MSTEKRFVNINEKLTAEDRKLMNKHMTAATIYAGSIPASIFGFSMLLKKFCKLIAQNKDSIMEINDRIMNLAKKDPSFVEKDGEKIVNRTNSEGVMEVMPALLNNPMFTPPPTALSPEAEAALAATNQKASPLTVGAPVAAFNTAQLFKGAADKKQQDQEEELRKLREEREQNRKW